jgi:hypothetical protein
MTTGLETAPAACEHCGALLHGAYCSAGGQKQLGHHDWALGHFLHDVWHQVAHLDSKIFHTLRLLFTQPGEATRQYLTGHRASQLNPIRLFLTVTAVFFCGAAAEFDLCGMERMGKAKGLAERHHALGGSEG